MPGVRAVRSQTAATPRGCYSPSAEPTNQWAQEPEATSNFALSAIQEGTPYLPGSRKRLVRADLQADL